MNLKHLLFVVFLFTMSLLHAQSLQDVVYLKNGTIVRGVIVEQIPNKTLTIETKDKNVFVFNMEDVDSIKKEKEGSSSKNKEASVKSGLDNGLKSGVFFEPSLIVAPVVDGDNEIKRYILTHVQGTANCQINNYIGLGIGAGLRSYSFEDTYLPLYGQFRVNFKNKPVSPYLETALGYGFALQGKDNGGAMFNFSFGFAKKIKSGQVRFGLVIDAFDRENYEHAGEPDDFGYYNNYQDIGSASFGVKLGLSF